MDKNDGKMECILDGCRGIYIPQDFAREILTDDWKGVSEEQTNVLETGPEHEFYWEVWDEVLDSASIRLPDGLWTLYQDGDLFLIHESYDWDEE